MVALYYDRDGMRIYLRNARGGVLVVQYPYLDMAMACSVTTVNYPGRDDRQYVSLREFGDFLQFWGNSIWVVVNVLVGVGVSNVVGEVDFSGMLVLEGELDRVIQLQSSKIGYDPRFPPQLVDRMSVSDEYFLICFDYFLFVGGYHRGVSSVFGGYCYAAEYLIDHYRSYIIYWSFIGRPKRKLLVKDQLIADRLLSLGRTEFTKID